MCELVTEGTMLPKIFAKIFDVKKSCLKKCSPFCLK